MSAWMLLALAWVVASIVLGLGISRFLCWCSSSDTHDDDDREDAA